MSRRKPRRNGRRRILVWCDDVRLRVPERVDCMWAARGVLGLARGLDVTRAGTPGRLHFRAGWTFRPGDRYYSWRAGCRTVDCPPAPAEAAASSDDDDLDDDADGPWLRDPDWWKGRN